MKIVLVRHGQTPANRLGALDTVRPGLGLTEEAWLRRAASRIAGSPRLRLLPPLSPCLVCIARA